MLETVFWASLSTLAFNVLFLQDCGFTSAQVGVMMAIVNIVAIIAPVIWGYFADMSGRLKLVFLLACTMLLITTIALPLSMRIKVLRLPLPCLMLALYQAAYAGAYSLLDAWVVGTCAERMDKGWAYSHIRLWGAIGYSLFSWLLTYAAQRSSIRTAYYVAAALGVIVLLWGWRLPEPKHTIPVQTPHGHKSAHITELLRLPAYLTLLAFNFIFHLCLYAASTFTPYLLAEIGLDPSFASAISGVRAVTEVPVYLLSSFFLKYIKPQGMLILAGLLYCVEHVVYLLATGMSSVVAAQAIGGFAYGMFLSVGPQMAQNLSSEPLHASAQTLLASLVFAGNIIASVLSGWIIGVSGARALFTITAALQIGITTFYTIRTTGHHTALSHK